MSTDTDLYFRQLALGDMANLVYLIGSQSTRECLVVDPAWDVDALLDQAAEDDMPVTLLLPPTAWVASTCDDFEAPNWARV